MKRNISLTVLAMIFLTMLCVGLAPEARAQDERGCSNASVAGKWGFTTNGTVVGIGPRASLGIFTLDAAGNLLNGKATASLNGSVTSEAFSGTYTVNPDCTCKFAIQIFDLSGNKIVTATLDLVFDNNVRELRVLYTSAVLPNGTPLRTVITANGKRIFSGEETTEGQVDQRGQTVKSKTQMAGEKGHKVRM